MPEVNAPFLCAQRATDAGLPSHLRVAPPVALLAWFSGRRSPLRSPLSCCAPPSLLGAAGLE
eukprot:4793913-Alexandrium_andersonii.AAC.1